MVLGIGYLRTFRDFKLPFTDEPVTAFWLIIALAYAVRRLPYALRSCMAALQQVHVSLEEAAENLGAEPPHDLPRRGAADGGRHPRRLRHQLSHRRGRAVGDHHAGDGAKSHAPMSYGIYLYMQSIAGADPAPRSA